MSYKTWYIIFAALLVMMVISIWFPYQRFNIPIEHSTIIRIILGVAVLGMCAAGYFLFLYRR